MVDSTDGAQNGGTRMDSSSTNVDGPVSGNIDSPQGFRKHYTHDDSCSREQCSHAPRPATPRDRGPNPRGSRVTAETMRLQCAGSPGCVGGGEEARVNGGERRPAA